MKKINKKVIVCALGIILGGAYCVNAHADDPSSEMFSEQHELKGMMADLEKSQQFTHQQWETRNPFDASKLDMNETPKTEETRQYVLQGIFLGSDRPSVIINGTVVGIGNTVSGATVRSISGESAVIVDSGGNTITLTLKQ